MLVPLGSRGRSIGIIAFVGEHGRPPYGRGDLALAEELAARVAAAAEHARSFAKERATAATLAQALLPGRLPEIPGL